MHAQQATREAEMANLQLAEMLKQALPQLGIDISPLLGTATAEASPLMLPPGELPPLAGGVCTAKPPLVGVFFCHTPTHICPAVACLQLAATP